MKRILIVVVILMIASLTGCLDVQDEGNLLNENYFTIKGTLYNYTNTSYKLYRFDSYTNYSYGYEDPDDAIFKLSYDIAKTLEKGKTYLFDYHYYETKGNVKHLDLLLIRNLENITVWNSQ